MLKNYKMKTMLFTSPSKGIKTLYLFVLLTFITTLGVSAQNCSATLEVEHGFSTRSAFAKGAKFSLVLTNTSSSEMTFDLEAISSDAKCGDARMEKTGKNVKVNTELLTSNAKSSLGNSITLSAGETFSFVVKAMPPTGTAYNKWSCVNVKATPRSCKTASIETTLKVFIPNPTQH